VHPSPAGLAFRHADETPYGGEPSPEAVASAERVFRGLRHLGFREREAREALAHARAQAEPTPVSDQRLLRAALQWLGGPSSSP
jgi:Holliday junction resolvasome RuvABC DNA-binding subunit